MTNSQVSLGTGSLHYNVCVFKNELLFDKYHVCKRGTYQETQQPRSLEENVA